MAIVEQQTGAVDQLFVDAALVEPVDSVDRYSRKPSATRTKATRTRTETALTAAACRSPVFLRSGCWPISPLCAPELVRFGEWLPQQWRADKKLARAWLARLGFPEKVVRPTLRENFSGVMQYGLRHHGLPLLAGIVKDSMLVDLGYVDGAALCDAYVSAEAGAVIDTSLYEVIAMELGLRTLLGESS